MNTRREFCAAIFATGVGVGVWKSLQAAQLPSVTQGKTTAQEETSENPNQPSLEKRMLDENEKDIKKKVEQLYKLAMELKAEVDKTDSSKVLSLPLLKKTEEIEKLAKDIRNRSKG